MKTKVCFKVLRDNRIVNKTIQIEHNFKVIAGGVFNGYKLPDISIESQVIDYLDSIDKKPLMDKYGFDIIFDYHVPRKRSKKKELQEFIDYLAPYISIEDDRCMRAIMFEAKDILFGKGKSNETKAKELFTIARISNKTILGTLDMVIKTFQNGKQIHG